MFKCNFLKKTGLTSKGTKKMKRTISLLVLKIAVITALLANIFVIISNLKS